MTKNLPLLLLLSFSSTGHAGAAPLNPLFEPALPTGAEDLVQIRRGILAIQEAQAKASGLVLRGTHAKGVCAEG